MFPWNSPAAGGVTPIETVVTGASIDVPADFLGLHVGRWPESREGPATITPAPVVPYGQYRPHDYAPYFDGGIRWNALNPTSQTTIQGIYDSAPTKWASFDLMCTSHRDKGAGVALVIFGTPGWQAGPQFQVTDQYGVLSGSAAATDLPKLGLFVTAYLQRAAATGVTIKSISGWNEPSPNNTLRTVTSVDTGANTITFSGTAFNLNEQVFFTSTGTLPGGINANTFYFLKSAAATTQISLTSGGAAIDITSAGTGTITLVRWRQFFWGTFTELAAMQKTIYDAAKAFNPLLTVVSPGMTSMQAISGFLNASNGAGGFGRDNIDMMAYHPYDRGIGPTYTAIGQSLVQAHTSIRAEMAAGGLAGNFPLTFDEQGWQSSSPTGLDFYLNVNDARQAVRLWRTAAVSAALDVKSHFFYGYDTAVTLGNPPPSISIVKQNMLKAITADFVGKTITDCWINNDGSVTIRRSDGIVITR